VAAVCWWLRGCVKGLATMVANGCADVNWSIGREDE